MNGDNIEITFEAEAIPAYLSLPTNSGGIGVVVISAIFGVTDEIKKIADDLSALGFPAIAPDMYWRTDPGPLSSDPAGYQRGLDRSKDYDRDLGATYVTAAMEELMAHPQCNGKVAVMGFCFGGAFALLGVTRLGAAGGVCFHGTDVVRHLEEFPEAQAPLIFHYGDKDPVAPMTEVNQIIQACEKLDDAQVFTYAGAQHAYMFPSRGPIFDPKAAELSWSRALEFLARL